MSKEGHQGPAGNGSPPWWAHGPKIGGLLFITDGPLFLLGMGTPSCHSFTKGLLLLSSLFPRMATPSTTM